MRKDATLSRVKEAINTLKLPLVVEDDNERSCHFKILLDKVKVSYEGDVFTDDSQDYDYPKSECNICGKVDGHHNGCPEDESPFAQLIRDGYD